MPTGYYQKGYYFIMPSDVIAQVSGADAVVENHAIKRALEIANQTGKSQVIVKVVDLVAPTEKDVNHSTEITVSAE